MTLASPSAIARRLSTRIFRCASAISIANDPARNDAHARPQPPRDTMRDTHAARGAARPAGPVRTAALLLACAALLCAAPAQARKKAEHPSVNVTTVLPPAVMAGLQRAHVPLSSIGVVVEKVG